MNGEAAICIQFSFGWNLFNIIFTTYYTSAHQDLWNDLEYTFLEKDVEEAIVGLHDRKDPGPMKITATFMKYNRVTLIPILTNLFNIVMATAIFPAEWKHSFFTPIPKKGAINDIANYRGIAMQSVIPKIFD